MFSLITNLTVGLSFPVVNYMFDVTWLALSPIFLQISTDGMNMINYDPRQFYAETEGGSSFKYM